MKDLPRAGIAASFAADSMDDETLPRSMSQDVTAGLRREILAGDLKPGERIGQDAIARRHGVSRVPVREALRLLEAEGLVTQTPHAGARVAPFDVDAIPELYELRELLEPMMLRHSVEHISPAQLDELSAIMTRVAAAKDDVGEWLLQDRMFHLASFQAAQMPTAMGMVERLYNLTQPFRRQYFGSVTSHELDMSQAEHEMILDAIRMKDGERAAALQRLHVRRTRVDFIAQRAAT